jgi:hypothetical protein
MRPVEIIGKVNAAKAHKWLSGPHASAIRDPAYFVKMGFDPGFVYRYCRKHAIVLCVDGTLAEGVWGVMEPEFIEGLAGALGAYALPAATDGQDRTEMARIARHCLTALTALEGRRRLG